MEIEKIIKDIITDENITLTEKLIKISVAIDKSDDWLSSISEIYNIPKLLLNEIASGGTVIAGKGKSENTNGIRAYIDVFYKCYEKMNGRKFEFTKKEIGQMKNIQKKWSYEQWREVLLVIYRIHNKRAKGVNHKKSWSFIIDNLSPSIIFNQYNFIMNEITAGDTGKTTFDWGNTK